MSQEEFENAERFGWLKLVVIDYLQDGIDSTEITKFVRELLYKHESVKWQRNTKEKDK